MDVVCELIYLFNNTNVSLAKLTRNRNRKQLRRRLELAGADHTAESGLIKPKGNQF